MSQTSSLCIKAQAHNLKNHDTLMTINSKTRSLSCAREENTVSVCANYCDASATKACKVGFWRTTHMQSQWKLNVAPTKENKYVSF